MNSEKKIKVLLVDDDKFLLEMYIGKFIKAGMEVNAAQGGSEGLKQLREGFAADIIITDLIMPDPDGMKVLETIQEEKLAPKAVLIVLSNQGLQTEIDRALSYKVHGYIVKATSVPSEVVEEVKRIAEKVWASRK
ncbi:MAG: response regulator [Candidatus Paceibacterota bacterium]|jgi:CheY-like chemotaxis protein